MFASCLTKDWAHQPPSNCQQNMNFWNSGIQNIKFPHDIVSSPHSVIQMPSLPLSKLPYFISPNHKTTCPSSHSTADNIFVTNNLRFKLQNIPADFRTKHPLHRAHNLHTQRGKQQDFEMTSPTSVLKRFHVRDIFRKGKERALMSYETNHSKKICTPDVSNRQQSISDNTANPVMINDEANMHSTNVPKTAEEKLKNNKPKYTLHSSEFTYSKSEINNNALLPSAFSIPIFSGKKENISDRDNESTLNPTLGMTYFMGTGHMTRLVQNSLTDDIIPKLGASSKNSIQTSFSSEYHFHDTSTRLFDALEDPKDIYGKDIYGRRLPSPRAAQHSSTSELSYSNIYHNNNQERKKFQCPQCRYITDRKNNLMRHIITMHQDSGKTLECCGIAFQSKSALREHNSVFHSGGYRCQICNRNFCRKALLRRHLTVHSGQKDFYCNLCGYATSHKSNLERHQKVHNKRCIGRSDVLGHNNTSDIKNCDEKVIYAHVYQDIQSDITQNDTCLADIFENEMNSADILSVSTHKHYQRTTGLELDDTSNSSNDESDFEMIDVDKSSEHSNFQVHKLNTNIEPNRANCDTDNNIHKNILGEKNSQQIPCPYYERANINQKVLKRKGFFTTRIYSTHGSKPFSHDLSRREKSNRFPYSRKRLSSCNGNSEIIDNSDNESFSVYKTKRNALDFNFDGPHKNEDVEPLFEEKKFGEEISEGEQERINYEYNMSGFISSRFMDPITYSCKENGEDCKCTYGCKENGEDCKCTYSCKENGEDYKCTYSCKENGEDCKCTYSCKENGEDCKCTYSCKENGEDCKCTYGCKENGEDCKCTYSCKENGEDCKCTHGCKENGEDCKCTHGCKENGEDCKCTQGCKENGEDCKCTYSCKENGEDCKCTYGCKENGEDCKCTYGCKENGEDCKCTYGCKENGEDCKCISEDSCSFNLKNKNCNAIGDDSSYNYKHRDNNCDCLDENVCNCRYENTDCKYMNDNTHGNDLDNKHCNCMCQTENVSHCNNSNSQCKNIKQNGCECKTMSEKCLTDSKRDIPSDNIDSFKFKELETNGNQHGSKFGDNSNGCKCKVMSEKRLTNSKSDNIVSFKSKELEANGNQDGNKFCKSTRDNSKGCKCKVMREKCLTDSKSDIPFDDIDSFKCKELQANGDQHGSRFCKSKSCYDSNCCKNESIDGNLIENKTQGSTSDISLWTRRNPAHLSSDYNPSKKYRICIFQYSCSSCHSHFRNQIDWKTHECSEKDDENYSLCFHMPIVMALRKGQLKNEMCCS